MKLIEIHFYPGRNIYSHRPVMLMLLDLGQWRSYCSDQVFARQLQTLLPGLAEHHCSRRRPGGFMERLAEGTYMGHVVEHVFLELQSMAGMATEYGKTVNRADGLTEVVCEYRCEQAVNLLAAAAVRVVRAVLTGAGVDVPAIVSRAREVGQRYLPGPSTEAILRAARRRSIPVERLDDGGSLYQLGTGCYQQRIQAGTSEKTGAIAADIAGSKALTKKILARQGLPVPPGLVARNRRQALSAAVSLGFPLVVKPDNGNQGKGITVQVGSVAELGQAFVRAAAFSEEVVVEKYLAGKHYRLLVVGGRLAAAAERIPAHVTGDGIHTVQQLVDEENKNPLRGEGHDRPLTRLVLDEPALAVLAKQGVSAESIPEQGRNVWLRENDNLSTGGTAHDCTDEVHPQQARLAERAAQAVGLDIAGVDLIMQDIGKPPQGQAGAILEINAAPGLRMHLYPSQGKRREVGQAIVEMLFPADIPCRVPVFSVTGTNGKTTTVRMLEFALRRHGQITGMCCTDGIYFAGEMVQKGDLTGPAGARTVLSNKEIEVAVLETARGGIVRRGLGYDRADVAVICNVREDHLGQDGIESMADLVHIKSLVAEAVYPGGTVVLNADDVYVNDFAAACRSEVIYFSLQGGNITVRRHLGTGGKAVFVRRGAILAVNGGRVTLVGRVRDFAVTLGGKATHQLENLLGAVAALWGYGLHPRQAGLYLRSFATSLQDNPGRANLYEIDGVKILVDYGHNADGIDKIGQLAKKMKAGLLIGVVGVPGDRRDELVELAGHAAGRFFDLLIIKEDQDLRGRRPGEVAALLQRGAQLAGMPVNKILTHRNERAAVRAAVGLARPGDLVVIFYEKLEQVQAEILNLPAPAGRDAVAPAQESAQSVAVALPRQELL